MKRISSSRVGGENYEVILEHDGDVDETTPVTPVFDQKTGKLYFVRAYDYVYDFSLMDNDDAILHVAAQCNEVAREVECVERLLLVRPLEDCFYKEGYARFLANFRRDTENSLTAIELFSLGKLLTNIVGRFDQNRTAYVEEEGVLVPLSYAKATVKLPPVADSIDTFLFGALLRRNPLLCDELKTECESLLSANYLRRCANEGFSYRSIEAYVAEEVETSDDLGETVFEIDKTRLDRYLKWLDAHLGDYLRSFNYPFLPVWPQRLSDMFGPRSCVKLTHEGRDEIDAFGEIRSKYEVDLSLGLQAIDYLCAKFRKLIDSYSYPGDKQYCTEQCLKMLANLRDQLYDLKQSSLAQRIIMYMPPLWTDCGEEAKTLYDISGLLKTATAFLTRTDRRFDFPNQCLPYVTYVSGHFGALWQHFSLCFDEAGEDKIEEVQKDFRECLSKFVFACTRHKRDGETCAARFLGIQASPLRDDANFCIEFYGFLANALTTIATRSLTLAPALEICNLFLSDFAAEQQLPKHLAGFQILRDRLFNVESSFASAASILQGYLSSYLQVTPPSQKLIEQYRSRLRECLVDDPNQLGRFIKHFFSTYYKDHVPSDLPKRIQSLYSQRMLEDKARYRAEYNAALDEAEKAYKERLSPSQRPYANFYSTKEFERLKAEFDAKINKLMPVNDGWQCEKEARHPSPYDRNVIIIIGDIVKLLDEAYPYLRKQLRESVNVFDIVSIIYQAPSYANVPRVWLQLLATIANVDELLMIYPKLESRYHSCNEVFALNLIERIAAQQDSVAGLLALAVKMPGNLQEYPNAISILRCVFEVVKRGMYPENVLQTPSLEEEEEEGETSAVESDARGWVLRNLDSVALQLGELQPIMAAYYVQIFATLYRGDIQDLADNQAFIALFLKAGETKNSASLFEANWLASLVTSDVFVSKIASAEIDQLQIMRFLQRLEIKQKFYLFGKLCDRKLPSESLAKELINLICHTKSWLTIQVDRDMVLHFLGYSTNLEQLGVALQQLKELEQELLNCKLYQNHILRPFFESPIMSPRFHETNARKAITKILEDFLEVFRSSNGLEVLFEFMLAQMLNQGEVLFVDRYLYVGLRELLAEDVYGGGRQRGGDLASPRFVITDLMQREVRKNLRRKHNEEDNPQQNEPGF